jgi:hypothetical protein
MSKSIGQWLGERLFAGARAVATQLGRFTRTRTPAQQKAENESWERNHMPRYAQPAGECAVCGKPRAVDTEHCSGPMKPWKAPNAATRRCAHTGPGEPGCVICDPRVNGGTKYV